jgi:hypothetical protein
MLTWLVEELGCGAALAPPRESARRGGHPRWRSRRQSARLGMSLPRPAVAPGSWPVLLVPRTALPPGSFPTPALLRSAVGPPVVELAHGIASCPPVSHLLVVVCCASARGKGEMKVNEGGRDKVQGPPCASESGWYGGSCEIDLRLKTHGCW